VVFMCGSVGGVFLRWLGCGGCAVLPPVFFGFSITGLVKGLLCIDD